MQRFHFSREETLPLADIINEIDDIWAENKSYKGDYASVVSKCYDYADELDLDYPEETEALRYAAGLLE